ncbi:MAG: efflux RND transporter periplasmic adaptor subunit, partial [Gammaproteobacteria bacterium]
AITLLRTAGETFDEVEIELADAVVSVIGPVLEEKRRNDRLILTKLGESLTTQARRVFGPHYFGRKLATAVALAVVSLFALVTGEYRVTSPATLEGRIQRTIVAPFDGYLASQHARAGEIVREGDVLASLDDQDLALERIRWSTRQRQSMAEYDQALAQGTRAEANIVRAQIDQAAAQVALLDEQLARTKLRAPFDGVVVSGDLSQSVGNALRRGEELFRIAPLAEHRVILEVDEGDVTDVEPGQQGTLRLASMPARPLPYTVERVTPVAEQGDGRNVFRVEARLDASDDRLRPGMEGVAKTEAGEKLVIRIWTEKLLDWLRLTSWKWLP